MLQENKKAPCARGTATTLLPRYRIKRCFASSSSALLVRRAQMKNMKSDVRKCDNVSRKGGEKKTIDAGSI